MDLSALNQVLVAIIVGLVSWALKLGFGYLSLHIKALKDARLGFIVEQAIRGAESYIEGLIKMGVEKFETPQQKALAKLEWAATYVVDQYPGVSTEQAKALVHAYLGRVGAGAVAFLTDLKAAAANPPAPTAGQ